MTIYSLWIIGFWIIFMLYWAVSAFTVKRTKQVSFLWLGIRAVLLFVLLTLFHSRIYDTFKSYDVSLATHHTLGIVGVVCTGLGIGFAIYARFHLGRNWGMPMTEKKEPELVTSGPYAYIRHPIYAGMLLAIFGSALVSGVWWLTLFFLATIYFVISANVEEQRLTTVFPTQYPDYMKRTKMIIPFIY